MVTELSGSIIPDSQKLQEIIKVYCFKSLSFGIVCYAAIENYDTTCNTEYEDKSFHKALPYIVSNRLKKVIIL